jgi:hypothetical protein
MPALRRLTIGRLVRVYCSCLDKTMIRSLMQQSAGSKRTRTFSVLRPTGVVKSFVACALAKKLCQDGYSAPYTRAQSLVRGLTIARADGLAQFARASQPHCMSWSFTSGPWLRRQGPNGATFGNSAIPLSGAFDRPEFATARHALA